MPEEIDFNKLAVEFVNKNIESFFNIGKDVLQGAADKVRLHLSRSYRKYLSCVTSRYSKAKSFFIRDEPTYLYNFYVPVGVSSKGIKINCASINQIANVNPFAVITGTGGSGKSMLMRHLFLDTIRGQQKVPVFIELRELNSSEQTLEDLIQMTLHANHFDLSDDYVEKAMDSGHFAFLLDGFDEIADGQRSEVSKEIITLAQKYDKNFIIVSSRPDEEFSRWSSFSIFSMDELTLEQATELVQRLPFESEVKTKFIKDLHSRLYREHKSFLSNPLLLSIMLLTYGQSADIPSKLSIFYSQAYEVLFQRHDAFKGAYQRERLSNLDIQDFSKVFSIFSLQTYDKRVFNMSRIEALEYIEKSKSLSGLNFNSSHFLKDAEQAVCLLIEDGLQLVFAHRSFQEFFTARYILSAKPSLQEGLIKKYAVSIGSDSVISLLHEMNPELVERLLIIPYIERLVHTLGIKRKVGVTHFLKYFRMVFSGLNIVAEGMETYSIKDMAQFKLISFIVQRYGLASESHWKSSRDFWKKLHKGGGMVRIPTSSLTTNSEITKQLVTFDGYFSLAGLEALIKLKNELQEKHQSQETSLEELLLS